MSYAVIIPSYNRPEMLKRALASVYAQTVRPSQICLTIDEPEDGEKYAFLGDYDDALQVTYTGGGYGGAKARNVGLDRVDDVDYVFFLDDDDEWLPEKTEKQIALLDQRPDAIGVTCYYYRIQHGVGHVVKKGTEKEINQHIRIWNFIGGFSCFGMRWSRAAAKIRLNNELSSCQDFDFYVEVSKLGSVLLLADASVNYYAHAEVRISDGRSKKGENFSRILKQRRGELSFREAVFSSSKVHLFSAPYTDAAWVAVGQFLLGSAQLIVAFKAPRVSYNIWLGCLRGLVHRKS